MADNIFLVSRSQATRLRTVNGVRAVLINRDSTENDATVMSHAVAQCNAEYGAGEFDVNYFDTVTNVTDLAAGPLKDPNDAYIFADNADPQKIEG